MATLISGVPELMESGLRGTPRPPGQTWRLRLFAVLAFLGLWSLVSGVVVLFRLFNPIFLPGPWLVVGEIVGLALKGQLWVHVTATLERVVLGFAAGALLALALGLLAGSLRRLRDLVEPVVELLRPIPPLAVLPLFIVWVGIGEASKVGFITYATFFLCS
jgi:NitT/TauT family transport system permease protein